MGRFSRLFGRLRPPSRQPASPPGFDAVWHPGEIAECIAKGQWIYSEPEGGPAPGPSYGDRLRVVRVVYETHPEAVGPIPFLILSPWEFAYPAFYFRKVVPQADPAMAAESAFIAQLRTIPSRRRQPASAGLVLPHRAHLHPLSADPLVRAFIEADRHG